MCQHMRWMACGLALLLLLAGCDQLQSSFKETLGADAPATQQSSSAAAAPAGTPEATAPASATPVATSPTVSPAAPPDVASSPATRPYKVSLSTGVALAQTLPEGTAMGFSVDYQFIQGGPNQSARYVWVILPGRGKPLAAAVQLEESGTLQSFFPPLKPEDGPFRCFIAEAVSEGQPQPISATVGLR